MTAELTEERLEGLQVRVARTPAEVEGLRAQWLALRPSTSDSDPDQLLAHVTSAPGMRPHVVCVEVPGHPPVLVVARVAKEAYRWRAAYHTLLRRRAPTILVSFGGVLGAVDEAGCLRALRVLCDQLRAGEADAVRFQKVEIDSSLHRALGRCGTRALLGRGPEVVHRRLLLPDSWETLLGQRSGKSRRQIRFDDNKVRRTFGDRLELRRYGPDEPDPRVLEDMRSVAARSYQRGLGVAAGNDPTSAALEDLACRRGWLRAWVLYVDGRPVAFWWGTLYAGTLSTGSPGYLPEFARERVGYYTLLRMIEDACADPAILELDFGHGDADYKERFASSAAVTQDVILFAARPAALLPRVLFALDAGTAWAAGRLSNTTIGHRIKRRLRAHAARRAAGSGPPTERAGTS